MTLNAIEYHLIPLNDIDIVRYREIEQKPDIQTDRQIDSVTDIARPREACTSKNDRTRQAIALICTFSSPSPPFLVSLYSTGQVRLASQRYVDSYQ